MATWPSDLPDYPLLNGYSEAPQSGVLRTQMDSGRPKRRKRYNAPPTQFNVQFNLTGSQLQTFEDFFETDLEFGALGFDWTHPRTGTSVSFYFVGSYKTKALSPDVFQVSFRLELLP
jgi:hypothetical protein